MGVAPSVLHGRVQTLTYLYDDPDHPDRVTGTIQTPEWTDDDRSLLLGLQMYEAGLCECGHPRETAWHVELEGWWEHDEVVCHACSAMRGEEVVYSLPRNEYPFAKKPELPPLELGVTTARPSRN